MGQLRAKLLFLTVELSDVRLVRKPCGIRIAHGQAGLLRREAEEAAAALATLAGAALLPRDFPSG